jgi:hypothetical protein
MLEVLSLRKAEQALKQQDYESAILLVDFFLKRHSGDRRARSVLSNAKRRLEALQIELAWTQNEKRIRRLRLAAAAMGRLDVRRKKAILETLGYWPLKSGK